MDYDEQSLPQSHLWKRTSVSHTPPAPPYPHSLFELRGKAGSDYISDEPFLLENPGPELSHQLCKLELRKLQVPEILKMLQCNTRTFLILWRGKEEKHIKK